MAKTKPIGVRFDEVILERIKKEENLKSPQAVLIFLENSYLMHELTEEAKKDIRIINLAKGNLGEYKNDLNESEKWTKAPIIFQDKEKQPERKKDESSLDYRIRIAEWRDNKNKE